MFVTIRISIPWKLFTYLLRYCRRNRLNFRMVSRLVFDCGCDSFFEDEEDY